MVKSRFNFPIIPFYCRRCEMVTNQIERVVDDRHPKYVKALECPKCEEFGIVLVDVRSA
jgi:hypothetical protein